MSGHDGHRPAGPSEAVRYDIVIPTVGRPSLSRLITRLDLDAAELGQVVVVDDRPDRGHALATGRPGEHRVPVRVVPGRASGPASARNIGWRATDAPWVVFLDDDTEPEPDWARRIVADLGTAGPLVAGIQADLSVPLPPDRRPTDWERNVAGLERAHWATADMALRREAIVQVGGFDERFPRAYREDADLALRLLEAGWELTRGTRRTVHPVRPSGFWASVAAQAGNADDVTMAVLHGRGWRGRAGVPAGTRRRHLLTVGSATVAAGALVGGRRRLAALALGTWAASTAHLAAARIVPGPRTRDEVVRMVVTSVVLPFAAVLAFGRGWLTAPRILLRSAWPSGAPDAVLFDRDGTLVDDVPYNGDPDQVRLRPTVRSGIQRLRSHGIAVAMVTNQSGVARGLLELAQVDAVNRRVSEEVGGLDHIEVCVHGPDDGCTCRKPAPGMILAAAAALGADPSRCVVIGDIGADIAAAEAAGARGILVPNPATRDREIFAAAEVARTVGEAVDRVLEGAP